MTFDFNEIKHLFISEEEWSSAKRLIIRAGVEYVGCKNYYYPKKEPYQARGSLVNLYGVEDALTRIIHRQETINIHRSQRITIKATNHMIDILTKRLKEKK